MSKILVLLGLILTFGSCNISDDLDGLNGGLFGGNLSANVNGVPFEASTINAEVLEDELGIYTFDDAANLLTLQFPANYNEGTYPFGIDVGVAISHDQNGGILGGSEMSGTLIISSKNTSTKKITGTFSCSVLINIDTEETIEVTSGSFSVTYK